MNGKHVTRVAMGIVAVCGWAGLSIGAEAPSKGSEALRGDLNGNGIHDAEDAALLAGVLAGAGSELGLDVLDVDASGRLDGNDLAMLKNWVARQEAADAADEPGRVLRGDLDGDGDIDETDALILMEVYMGLIRPPAGLESADVDGNGRIEIADLIAITEILYGRREPSVGES